MLHKLSSKVSDRIHKYNLLSQDKNQQAFQIAGKDDCKGYKSCVYFSNWSVYGRKHFAIDIPVEFVTHVFYAFITIDANTGNVKFTDEWCDLQLPLESPVSSNQKVTGSIQQLFQMKQLNRHLKVVMSIGGWGTEHLFQAVTSDHAKLDNFINSAVKFVCEYGFDGIDIDWEYPRNTHECKQLVKLLSGLKQKLNLVSPDYLLTIASPGGDENIEVLDFPELDKYLSFWNVMCYDFCGEGWSTRTGYHSNLYGNNGDNNLSASNIIEKYIQHGVSPQKLILGMPLYGRVFHGALSPTVGHSFTKEILPGSVNGDTCDYKLLPISQESFDEKTGSCSYYDSQTKQLFVYDNPQVARMKADFTSKYKLGGGMWWDSCGDVAIKEKERSLIYNYIQQLGGSAALEKTPNHI